MWVAITVSRSREEPSGTVGGRIPWAKTPRSSASSQSRIVGSASPTSIGRIWVVEPPTARPSAASAARSVAAFRCSASTRSGSVAEDRQRLGGGGDRGDGGGAVEKMKGRAVLTR